VTQWDLTPNDFLGGANFDLGGAKDPNTPPPLVAPVIHTMTLSNEMILDKMNSIYCITNSKINYCDGNNIIKI